MSALDAWHWHPGAAWPDEHFGSVGFLQECREGRALPFEYAKGCIHRLLCFLACQPSASFGRLHLPVFFAFLIENIALFAIARRALNQRAAALAVITNALAAFSLLRLRSLLAYSILPAELLALIALLPMLQRRRGALAWGLFAALGLVDYEAWLLALPVLALLALHGLPPRLRPALAAGFAMGLAIVLYASAPGLKDYFEVRSSQSVLQGASPLWRVPENLWGYLWGSSSISYLGVDHWGAFPRFAWPALLAGLWTALRLQWRWLAWLAIGCIPLISAGTGHEPQRLIVAWPALCLIAGLGFERWLQDGGRAMAALVAAVLLVGAATEALAFQRSQNGPGALALLPSQQAQEAVRRLKPMEPIELFSDLDSESGAVLRFIAEDAGLTLAASGKPAALISWDYARGLEREGVLQALSAEPGPAPLLLFLPDAPAAARLRAVQQQLAGLGRALPSFDRRQRRRLLLQALLKDPRLDPWVRSVLFERVLGESSMIGEFPYELCRLMQGKDFQSVTGLLMVATRLQAPAPQEAAAWRERAWRLDPRRRPR